MTQRDVFSSSDDRLDFVSGRGVMGERFRVMEWSRTSLSPVAEGPQSWRSALSICLNASFPIAIYWGRELRALYNDDWSCIPGEKRSVEETCRIAAQILPENPHNLPFTLLYLLDQEGRWMALAGHIAAAVANARAYEEERRRAEALAELERANTAFYSNVSHEFRTPLTLMLGPLEGLLAKPRASEYRELLTLFIAVHFGCKSL